ncbi:type I methionyl aminopeptidase [Cohnella sp. GCM10027633]|uniref:type I methionyl aminopeptidase n=1 Tax=unclassified Cohnella TaxID=2636738 RepID=UPI00363068B1
MAGGKSGIAIRTKEEIAGLAVAGRLAAKLRRELGRRVKPGVTTLELNRFADEYMAKRGAYPAQIGFHGYPYAICAAVNDCVCHGLPDDRPLRDGDLVTLDFVVELNGWMADTAWTYAVGDVSPQHAKLRSAAYRAMMNGIAETRPKRTLGDIAEQVRLIAEAGGFGVISQFGGHGIGRAMHEPPEIPFVGQPGKGVRLREGMVVTIEPMLTIGDADIYMKEDGWSIMTEKGGWAAQFEHTVAVTADGPLILTK